MIVKLLFNMVCCRPRHVESPCGNLGPGVVRPDQEEIGIIVALEIGVQLGIKEESERSAEFTRMNLFLEEM